MSSAAVATTVSAQSMRPGAAASVMRRWVPSSGRECLRVRAEMGEADDGSAGWAGSP